jgi:hypothetical protein
MTHPRDNRDMNTTRPAPLIGQLATHPTGTRKPARRTNGQVRAAERQQWQGQARRAVATLKLVTV